MAVSKEEILDAIANMTVMDVVELIEDDGGEVRRQRRCGRGRRPGWPPLLPRWKRSRPSST
jgi:hypothetical protein